MLAEQIFKGSDIWRHFRNLDYGGDYREVLGASQHGQQVALISLGADCAVGVVGKTCIGVPTRLIYSLKSWIDKSFIKRFK